MKVLAINKSPRIHGNTSLALNEMKKVFDEEVIDFEIAQIGTKDVHGCFCAFIILTTLRFVGMVSKNTMI